MSSQQSFSIKDSESATSSSDDSNIERDGPGGQPHLSLGSSSPPVPQMPPRRSHSETTSSSRQYYSHRENDLPPLPSSELSNEARRQSIMAIDRKRRLTASAYDSGRRRTTTGGFTSRENRFPASPYRRPAHGHDTIPHRRSSHGQDGAHGNPDVREVIDLTVSSPPAEHSPLPARPAVRRTSNGSRNYIVPRWQPDAEVSECPICHRQFTIWFRRHHCRKCGRVVCNECSPHRITIPKQYIVQPPGYEEDFLRAFAIDLTRADDDDDNIGYRGQGNTSRRISSALGGGEKVRLCNPCVPDPQPVNPTLFEQISQSQPQASNPPSLPHLPQPLGSLHQRQASHGFHGRDQQQQQPHPGTRVNLTISSDNDDSESSPEAYTSASHHQIMQALASSSRPQPPFGPAHSRYYSLDATRGPLPPLPQFGNRARVYSGPQQFGASGITLPHSSHRVAYRHPGRPRIREEDMCPICRELLPPKGADGDETDRENHIMDCISRHDPTAPLSTSRPRVEGSAELDSNSNMSTSLPAVPTNTTSTSMPSSSTSLPRAIPTQMVRFIATEKDCIAVSVPGEDEPQPQECSICMVEYEVGDQLARLECWCKFHQECIVEWFGRKRECPVHKIS